MLAGGLERADLHTPLFATSQTSQTCVTGVRPELFVQVVLLLSRRAPASYITGGNGDWGGTGYRQPLFMQRDCLDVTTAPPAYAYV